MRVGIDAGSVNTKVVVFDEDVCRIVGRAIEPTGLRPREAAVCAFKRALAEAGLEPAALSEVVATGYARHAVEWATDRKTEITAVAAGIGFWHCDCQTIIDLGGQDTKVIALDVAQGRRCVSDFAMNDRCAAGTGNFLAVLARALAVPLEKFGELAGQSLRPAHLSSLCVVMAESEILSLVAADTPVSDIVAGLHAALARRVSALAARVRVEPPVIFTGGVAQNIGMVKALQKELGLSIVVCREPLFAAALGAALPCST